MQIARKSTPNKRSPEREHIILTALEWGATFSAAAKLAGVSTAAIDKWRRGDPDFDLAVKRAKERLHAKQKEALSEEEQCILLRGNILRIREHAALSDCEEEQ
jgi:transposase-like protein